jgi:hypothetical protein
LWEPHAGGQHLIGITHLRQRFWAHKGANLDTSEAGRNEPLEESDLRVGRNEGLDSLVAVARTNFDDRDLITHATTPSLRRAAISAAPRPNS